MSLDILTKPFASFNCKGTISFNDGVSRDANLTINLIHNGSIHGDIEFPSDDLRLISYIKQTRNFSLSAVDQDNNKTIRGEKCILTSYNGKNCKFSTHRLMWDPSEIRKKTNKELSFKFSILNVFETLGVRVQTSLGTLDLWQYKSHKQLEQLMSDYEIPLITSLANLHVKNTKNRTIERILKEATQIIRDFLKVTSLAQTCWHDWAILEVYKQIRNSEQGKLIYREMRTPKLKPPHYRQLTNPAHSSNFVTAAWNGYSHENDKFGFDYALEWYVESNSVQLDVIRFVLATTCLELLISKFYSLKLGSKNTAQDNHELISIIKKSVKKILKEKEIDNDTKSKILQAISIKPSYEMKTKQLLEYWGISIGDIQTPISEIVRIRDRIIHRGMYFHDEDLNEALKVIKGSDDLFQILTRIFLAMLKYDEQYYDPRTLRWIRFEKVCSKIGNPGFT